MLGHTASSMCGPSTLLIPPDSASLRPGYLVHALLVLPEASQHRESAAAHRARERLLPRVRPLVPEAVLVVLEHLGTVFALQRGIRVVPLDVPLHVDVCDAAETAIRAELQLPDVMDLVGVLFQRSLPPELSTAR